MWGNNNNPGNTTSCSQDDAVDDTPRCIGVTSCNVTSNTCSNDAVDGYWTSDVVDNVENYMEYSYCSKMFTPGQNSRMRAALLSGAAGRNNLWTNSNHTATGLNQTPTLCAVDFRSNRDVVCGGENVEFFDESYNNVNSWSWVFQGGSPSTSTLQNPVVTYASAGTYDVQLADPKSRVLQIQGPAAIDIMKAASNNVIDETFKYFCSGFYDIGDQCLYVSRTGFTNELGFEIYCNKDTDHLALWDFLVEVGKKYGMEFSSTKAMTMRRIEGGILGNLTDMTSDMTPFDAGIGGFVDLRKHSFIGKEALIER